MTSSPDLAIPDNSQSGAFDEITVGQDGLVGFVEVQVDITHTFRGDLVVRLRAPSGVAAILHDRRGGRADDLQATYASGETETLGNLLGEPMAGDWRLEVLDLAAIDTGILNSWKLTLRPMAEAPAEVAEEPGVTIPDNDPAGIVRTLTASGGGTVGAPSVMIDITHTFIRDLVVSVVSPQGTKVTLHNRTGGGADNIITTYTEATTPALAELQGESIAGEWRLEVADLEGLDIGKLNRWAVRFRGSPIG